MANPVYGWQEREAHRSRFPTLRATLRSTVAGFSDEPEGLAGTTTEERRAILETLYADGSLALWLASTTAGSDEAAAEIAEFVRDRMRARLNHAGRVDPRLIEILVPTAGRLDRGRGAAGARLPRGLPPRRRRSRRPPRHPDHARPPGRRRALRRHGPRARRPRPGRTVRHRPRRAPTTSTSGVGTGGRSPGSSAPRWGWPGTASRTCS